VKTQLIQSARKLRTCRNTKQLTKKEHQNIWRWTIKLSKNYISESQKTFIIKTKQP